jgi:hypothetical protein
VGGRKKEKKTLARYHISKTETLTLNRVGTCIYNKNSWT